MQILWDFDRVEKIVVFGELIDFGQEMILHSLDDSWHREDLIAARAEMR